MRRVVVFLAIMAASCQSRTAAPVADAKANLKTQAQAMVAAVLAENHTTLADYSHPNLVRQVVGREAYIRLVERVVSDLKAKGFTVTEVVCGEPSEPVPGGKELYAVVPKSTAMTGPGGIRMRTNGFLIAGSTDQGRTWEFVDGAGIGDDRVKVKAVFPDFPDGLTLPKKEPPVIEGPKP